MQKIGSLLLTFVFVIMLAACGTENTPVDSETQASESNRSSVEEEESDSGTYSESQESTEEESNSSEENAEADASEPEQRLISVTFGDSSVIYELNDGSAADSLYEMLPLTVQVEDYSTNEKIFYPDQELDTSDSPLAQAGAGTLAYYEPWGDVVFFYGDYNENSALFELGQTVSGAEQIGEMSGTITIETVE